MQMAYIYILPTNHASACSSSVSVYCVPVAVFLYFLDQDPALGS